LGSCISSVKRLKSLRIYTVTRRARSSRAIPPSWDPDSRDKWWGHDQHRWRPRTLPIQKWNRDLLDHQQKGDPRFKYADASRTYRHTVVTPPRSRRPVGRTCPRYASAPTPAAPAGPDPARTQPPRPPPNRLAASPDQPCQVGQVRGRQRERARICQPSPSGGPSRYGNRRLTEGFVLCGQTTHRRHQPVIIEPQPAEKAQRIERIRRHVR
jgi:hypothetical protein